MGKGYEKRIGALHKDLYRRAIFRARDTIVEQYNTMISKLGSDVQPRAYNQHLSVGGR